MTTKPPLQNIRQGTFTLKMKAKKSMRGHEVLNHRTRKDKQSESSINLAEHNQILKQQKQLNGSNPYIPINRLNSPIKNKTGLKGRYDNLLFTRDPPY
jgi:hypothetical protein